MFPRLKKFSYIPKLKNWLQMMRNLAKLKNILVNFGKFINMGKVYNVDEYM